MRLLTWNINGVRTLPQYHPWNSLKNFDEILNHLGADIICFQEMKSGRKLLTQEVAVPPSFDSFFSFPIKKTGYSGVATYTRTSRTVPAKAEEGLSGLLQPKPPLSPDERVSPCDSSYPPNMVDDAPDNDGRDESIDYANLDSEGRAIVVDLGLFVLVNTYCPNDGTGTEEREAFKMAYHRLLETRVRALIEEEKREVIVVGDLNACAAVIDHCEGHIMVKQGQAMGLEGEEGFWGKDCRQWIRDWLQNEDGAGGPMVDIVRRFWPDRQGMYTCWNTKISARDTNYGTRIDYVLITPGLVPWIKAADIQPHIKGSDHCPVYVDFHDSIVDTSSGEQVRLVDVMSTASQPPRIAARFWDEFSGKQTSLQQFFLKSKAPSLSKQSSNASTPSAPKPQKTEPLPQSSPTMPLDITSEPSPLSPPPPPPPPSNKRKSITSNATEPKKKAKKNAVASGSGSATRGKSTGQSTIASFFGKPPPTKPSSTPATKGKGRATTEKQTKSNSAVLQPIYVDDDDDEDYKLALQLSQEPPDAEYYASPSSSQLSQPQSTQRSKQAWNTLLAPTQVPKCDVHNEPAKEFTVKKPGPNKGKKFFTCSRPVGPGYDKGRSERAREDVDPQFKCDFFKWASDVRKEMMQNTPHT